MLTNRSEELLTATATVPIESCHCMGTTMPSTVPTPQGALPTPLQVTARFATPRWMLPQSARALGSPRGTKAACLGPFAQVFFTALSLHHICIGLDAGTTAMLPETHASSRRNKARPWSVLSCRSLFTRGEVLLRREVAPPFTLPERP